MNHALVNAAGTVTDVFVGALSNLYKPPAGHRLVPSDEARVGDRYDVGAGTFEAPAYDGPSLDDIKDGLKKAVDLTAERLRTALITPGSGQAMEYQESYAQAKAALAADEVGETVEDDDYPMLAATVGIDRDPETGDLATDVLGVARSVKVAYETYLQAGAAIKEARLKGKRAIGAATSPETADAAFLAIQWPSFG